MLKEMTRSLIGTKMKEPFFMGSFPDEPDREIDPWELAVVVLTDVDGIIVETDNAFWVKIGGTMAEAETILSKIGAILASGRFANEAEMAEMGLIFSEEPAAEKFLNEKL